MIVRTGLRAPLAARALLIAATILGLLVGTTPQASAATQSITLPRAALDGYVQTSERDATHRLQVAIELDPKDRALDELAAALGDPASPMHRATLSREAFVARFGRPQSDVEALAALLRTAGATNVFVSTNRLVVGGDLTVAGAERAFNTTLSVFKRGDQKIVAPTGPLSLPLTRIRAVRGLITRSTPQFADTPQTPDRPHLPTDFRGDWFLPARFREAYDAVADGGAGTRIVLIGDSSNPFDPKDVERFVRGDGPAGTPAPSAAPSKAPPTNAPPSRGRGERAEPPLSAAVDRPYGADAARVSQRIVTPAGADQRCGRDDRGQESTIDVDAAIALAPKALIDVRLDAVCVAGSEGTLALQRVLDDTAQPDVIVFPFAIAALVGPTAERFGPTPIAYLEAAVRGIPVVVPAGDDGAFGVRENGLDRAAVAYPCVLPYVICAGGTQVGARANALDEGPWNDGTHATGGGISADPRPKWQNAPSAFEFSADLVRFRIVPDVSADAAGHLRIFWHGYGLGGVGGTSESAALVGAQLAAINAAIPKEHRLAGAGDLYALAREHPQAFRDITRENDRAYRDNTLRPRPKPIPLGYRGVVPTAPPPILGCALIQPSGCAVAQGYDAVTGIGSLKERAAIDALKR